MSIPLLTALALVAFASNSILCRMALGDDLIDPVSFTAIRLISGAAVLVPLARTLAEPERARAGSWLSGLALCVYAFGFSLAYVSIDAGSGALLLFGMVQVTMLATGVAGGDRPGPVQWTGLMVAFAGLVYLVSPGLTAPDRDGAVMMSVAGVGWAVYSLRGRRATAPVAATAGNFVRAAALAIPVVVVLMGSVGWGSPAGLLLAALSGAITSGLGYVIWYRTLPHLTTVRAAVVQLLVPVLTALAGAWLLDERVTIRLVVASLLILGGVAAAVLTGAVGPRTARPR